MPSLFNSTSNYSFYVIPTAWVLALLPHAYASSLSKSFDSRSPRTFAKSLENDQAIDQATKDRILRCEGAQANGFENIAFFATAVVAGNLAGLPAQTLSGLSGGYLLSRIMYTYIYINNTTDAMAKARSVVFFAGIGQIFTLFIKAGNALKNKPANLI